MNINYFNKWYRIATLILTMLPLSGCSPVPTTPLVDSAESVGDEKQTSHEYDPDKRTLLNAVSGLGEEFGFGEKTVVFWPYKPRNESSEAQHINNKIEIIESELITHITNRKIDLKHLGDDSQLLEYYDEVKPETSPAEIARHVSEKYEEIDLVVFTGLLPIDSDTQITIEFKVVN